MKKLRAVKCLLGRPRPPRFTSEAIGHKPHTYNVTWTTDSIAPVTEYKLFYRQSDVSDESASRLCVVTVIDDDTVNDDVTVIDDVTTLESLQS